MEEMGRDKTWTIEELEEAVREYLRTERESRPHISEEAHRQNAQDFVKWLRERYVLQEKPVQEE